MNRQPIHTLDTTGATTGQVPTVNAAGDLEYGDPAGGGASTLDALTDVDTTGAADGDTLVLDAGTWRPTPGSGALLRDSDAPVPATTPVGTIVFTKTTSGSNAAAAPVLLLEAGATVPSGTAAGTIIFEKVTP